MCVISFAADSGGFRQHSSEEEMGEEMFLQEHEALDDRTEGLVCSSLACLLGWLGWVGLVGLVNEGLIIKFYSSLLLSNKCRKCQCHVL